MPTLNHIWEEALDRHHEGRDEQVARPSKEAACPLCDAVLSEAIELSWHLNEAHPLERPVLIVRGTAAPRHTMITRSLDPTDIELANTTHVQVHQNGQHVRSMAWEDVPRMISESRRGI